MKRSNSFTNFELMMELLKDSERKSIFQITQEILKLTLLYKSIPGYYFSRYLFKTHCVNIENYLPNKFLYNLKSRFNEKEVCEVIENKLYFDLFYRQLGINVPDMVMYNHRQCFVLGKEAHNVANVEDFRNLVNLLIKERLSGSPLFIKKMYSSYGGERIYKLSSEDLKDNHELVNEVYREVIASGYVYQETLKQHPDLDRLNPSCLNTLRIDTFFDQNGSIEIVSSYFKTNLKNHFIDNERSGGCEIPIDLQTGKLKKFGYLTLKYNGLSLPTEHPITKVQFEDFQIPYFEDAKQLAIRAASYMPGIRLIGWDVAIGPESPVLVEGNSDYDIATSDLSYGGYKANPVFQKVLEEIGYLD